MLMKSNILKFVLLGTLSAAVACDRSADDLIPMPSDDLPAVIDIGEMAVMGAGQLAEFQDEGSGSKAWCDDNSDAEGRPYCYYGVLGQAEVGIKGGATFTFRGTGDQVCVVTDPETVFWNTAVASVNPNDKYSYADLEEDDGDIDLFGGLSSYYTGSPGVELGDFQGQYTDSLGNSVDIEYGECFQYGAQTGVNNAHAGRASVEYCTINSSNREGKLYTIVLESFSIPLDDGALGFGAVVLEGSCSDYVLDECTLYGEGLSVDRDKDGVAISDGIGGVKASPRACTIQLERAACDGNLLPFCCEYPAVCGEDADQTQCETAEAMPDNLNCPSYCDTYADLDADLGGSCGATE
jgi:hypothetical protein